MLPADAEVVRSAVDDDDVSLLAKGLGYTVLVSTAGPVALMTAATHERVNAVANGLRERARAAARRAPRPRRVSTCRRLWGRYGHVGLNRWFMADVSVPSSSPTGGSIIDLDITTEQMSATMARRCRR